MNLVAATAQFRVYDEVLSPDAFQAVWYYVQSEEYRSAHAERWQKVWRVLDGAPLQGPLIYSEPASAEDRTPAFPTGRGVDRVFRAVTAVVPDLAPLRVPASAHGRGFTAQAHLYPAGSGLSWHRDEGPYAGAYAFYAHPAWNTQWGGELLIAHPSTDGRDAGPGRVAVWDGRDLATLQHDDLFPYVDNARESELLSAVGLGAFVHPKPNRLVVLAPGVYHRIQPVHPAAGDRVRATVSGFFLSARSALPR